MPANRLTIGARDTYEVGTEAVLEPGVLRAYNELLHRVTDAVVQHSRTVEADGDKVKFTYEGVAANGNAISYTFTVTYDGKDYPITGSGATGGADAISVKQLGPRSFTSTLKKAGVPVVNSRVEISTDGKVTTQHISSADGKASINNTVVFDKQ